MMAFADPLLKTSKNIWIFGPHGLQPINIIIKIVNIRNYINISLMILEIYSQSTYCMLYMAINKLISNRKYYLSATWLKECCI